MNVILSFLATVLKNSAFNVNMNNICEVISVLVKIQNVNKM